MTGNQIINDAHCHFFSSRFFAALGRQLGTPELSGADVCRRVGWDDPGTPLLLADRWVAELDANSVRRAALIASVPGDEDSVAEAIERHPSRFVGFFMLDPSAVDAVERAGRAVGELGLRAICLFPAMHHVPLGDDRVRRVVEVAAQHRGTAVFVHCGTLSVGVRDKLGLPSRFDMRLGNPNDVSHLARAFPSVPFIIPHFGAGRFREALAAAAACENVYVDTSSSNRWIQATSGLTLDDVFKTSLSIVGPSRMLFGTDSSFFPRGWQRSVWETQNAAVTAAGISAADAALIFRGNFDRIFD